jgi:hypothetical protein
MNANEQVQACDSLLVHRGEPCSPGEPLYDMLPQTHTNRASIPTASYGPYFLSSGHTKSSNIANDAATGLFQKDFFQLIFNRIKRVDISILFIIIRSSVLWKLSWYIWSDIAPKGVALWATLFIFAPASYWTPSLQYREYQFYVACWLSIDIGW